MTVQWVPSAVQPLGVVAATDVAGGSTIHWGDGEQSPSSGQPKPHIYNAAGAYKVTVWQDGAAVDSAQVTVRNSLKPKATFAPSDDNPNIIEATISDDPADLVSVYRFDWGDGSQPQEVTAPKGTVVTHGYPAGDYTVTVTDTHTRRTLREPIAVEDPEYDPDFTLEQGSAGTMSAKVTLTVADGGKDILVDWGADGEQTTLPAAKVGDTAEHTYTAATTTIVQVVYTDGSTDGSAQVVTVPWATATEAAAEGPP